MFGSIKKALILVGFIFFSLIFATSVSARVSVNDIYQQKRQAWEQAVSKLSPQNQTKVKKADQLLKEINLKVCSRFDEDIAKLTAIDMEIRLRKGLEEVPTVVAYGEGKNQLENAEYWLNYAQEAVAYQKIADYAPQVSGDSSVEGAIKSKATSLKSDLGVLKNKILRAKNELKKVLDEKE